jgi:hypothetical protein
MSEHVERGGLALPLGDDPVLDPDVLAAVRIGPARNVAGREESGRARFEKGVHDQSAVEPQTGLLRKFAPGLVANRNRLASGQSHPKVALRNPACPLYRAIATRYDKLAYTFLTGVLLVCVILWLK